MTKKTKSFNVEGIEMSSFTNFLDGKPEKIVRLERILGIGGEGIVLSDKMTTKEHHYRKGWEERNDREVAVKFVKFGKTENENFEGPEKEDKCGDYGGIDESGKWVTSQYFVRLYELGDYNVATYPRGGYSRPYIDFAISKIHNHYFFVIGEFIFSYQYFEYKSFKISCCGRNKPDFTIIF